MSLIITKTRTVTPTPPTPSNSPLSGGGQKQRAEIGTTEKETVMNNETQTPNQGIDIDFSNQQFEFTQAKPWWQSKTMWLNLAVTGLGVASTVVPVLRPFVNARTFGMITTGIGVANTVLRMVTHKPIKGGKGDVRPLPTFSQSAKQGAGRD